MKKDKIFSGSSDSEEFYLKVIDIREHLVKENLERYSWDLARSYFYFAISTKNDGYFKKAYEIAKKHPYNPNCRKIIEVMEGD